MQEASGRYEGDFAVVAQLHQDIPAKIEPTIVLTAAEKSEYDTRSGELTVLLETKKIDTHSMLAADTDFEARAKNFDLEYLDQYRGLLQAYRDLIAAEPDNKAVLAMVYNHGVMFVGAFVRSYASETGMLDWQESVTLAREMIGFLNEVRQDLNQTDSLPADVAEITGVKPEATSGGTEGNSSSEITLPPADSVSTDSFPPTQLNDDNPTTQ